MPTAKFLAGRYLQVSLEKMLLLPGPSTCTSPPPTCTGVVAARSALPRPAQKVFLGLPQHLAPTRAPKARPLPTVSPGHSLGRQARDTPGPPWPRGTRPPEGPHHPGCLYTKLKAKASRTGPAWQSYGPEQG